MCLPVPGLSVTTFKHQSLPLVFLTSSFISNQHLLCVELGSAVNRSSPDSIAVSFFLFEFRRHIAMILQFLLFLEFNVPCVHVSPALVLNSKATSNKFVENLF